MRRLLRPLLATLVALSLAISLMAAATEVCADATMPVASDRAAHDCDAPSPDTHGSDDHHTCRMLAPCVSIDLGRTIVTLASVTRPRHVVPSASTSTPPATLARTPAPPPPRA